jgi:hypothetical protein
LALAADAWSLQDVIGNEANGASTLSVPSFD